jgi:N-acetyl-anhydromuramyl-L-alanine amidase AmpD
MKRNVDLIVIHCSATKETINYTFDQCIRDHKARGFNTCGYHRFISKDGKIHIGRHFDKAGAHVLNYNANSIGICYEGGLDANGKAKDTRTEAQKASLKLCIMEAMQYGHINRICGHRDLSPDLDGDGIVEPDEWVKQCPCFESEKEYKELI